MNIPLVLDRTSRQSLQAQIFEQLRTLILTGRLKPGAPVPTSRELCEQLGVSRNTITLAYARLVAEDYLQTQRSVGTFVSVKLPQNCLGPKRSPRAANGAAEDLDAHPSIRFRGQLPAIVNPHPLNCDFWLGRPDARSFPVTAWRQLLNRALASAGSRFTEYRDPGGLPKLQKALADHLGPARGISVAPDQIIITGGSQGGLDLAARLLISEGSRVATENPSYQGAVFAFQSYRAELVPVPVDENGINADLLPLRGVTLLYVTPSHQYPLGFTLSLERRLKLLEWAHRCGAYIIEDDYDSDFHHRGSPLTALMGLDTHDCVMYLGTFSKSMGPGLRLGYLVVPRHLIEPAHTAKALMDNGHPWLNQAAMAEFLVSGGYLRHLRRIRHLYGERQDCLVDTLKRHFGQVQLSGLEGGMHLAWHLSDDFVRASELQEVALKQGVGIYDLRSGAAYDFGGCAYSERTVVLGFSSVEEHLIRSGLERVAVALGRGGANKGASVSIQASGALRHHGSGAKARNAPKT